MKGQRVVVLADEEEEEVDSKQVTNSVQVKAGHVACMGKSRNAYRVLVGRPEGKRPLGRLKLRWEDNIKMDLREVGYDDRDWINLAQDRVQWQAYSCFLDLIQEASPLTVMGFADDTVIGNSEESAIELTRLAIQRFHEIGLSINSGKCSGLSIVKRKLNPTLLIIEDECKLTSVTEGEQICYLGITYQDSSIFDLTMVMKKLHTQLDILTSSSLLKADKKFTVLSSSICPSLIYPYITSEFNKIPTEFLQDADKMIESSHREILYLPTDVPDNMIYSEKK
ncbi:hypothetical protein ANN_22709 [Periplaneta americana]|uniref:Reverse transcriptase domain-containing protein n=1 Tax=Periplaneta americana TaxID=6978 RepID=A0ABQ8S994_PERAM|nr:hypothetical protein ANN_22709 [Periplaneta americana]